jgi:tetratricopeptide (TPR) repeat protein
MRSFHLGALHRLAALIAVFSLLVGLSSPRQGRAESTADFVGGKACAGCHKARAEAWRGSHHAMAMQEATVATVLGDFNGASLQYFGVTTTFSRSDGKFRVRTDGPDGAADDFEIAYTFGVYPLQQYLIAMPGGRLQALGIAWDSRSRNLGGQRWFHLYADQKILAGDRLHWTGRDQTWNYMCADCHSTGLSKNYDLVTNAYTTTWSDVDVSCESCHGPGSNHVTWARSPARPSLDAAARGDAKADRLGLTNWLKPTDKGRWEMNADIGIARRTEPLVSAEIDTCAACHSRRRPIAKNAHPGAPLLDSYAPTDLEAGLYHADGQIDGEVFEYGSFVQSRMYHAGVTCSDCHEPHGLKLRFEGNLQCGQCHMPSKFDTTEHHHHVVGSAGSQCINCHMPTKTYMVVDSRRDHSFRVPRPDLSASVGAPNSCTQCHTGQQPDRAARAIAEWFPLGRQTRPNYGTALRAGRIGAAGAEQALDQLIMDPDAPGIARASALLLLPRHGSPASASALQKAIADADPLVRAAAPRAPPVSSSRAIVQDIASLFVDPIRAVRIEAARALSGIDPQTLTSEQRSAFNAAYAELMTAETINADRPEAHLNMGLLDVRRQRLEQADVEYRTALRLDPMFVPAMVNLADLDRMRGVDQQGADLLRKAISLEPENADARYSLGLLLVRLRNYAEALPLLRQASELAPGNSRYTYVYAIALNTIGSSDQAITVLESAHRQNPGDRDALVALFSIERDKGKLEAAILHGRELIAQYPEETQFRAMVLELEKQQTR